MPASPCPSVPAPRICGAGWSTASSSARLTPAASCAGAGKSCSTIPTFTITVTATPPLIPHPELTHPRTPHPLAVDEVRYAGELVAVVVADDRYLAEDAARLIDVEYEPLPAVVELEAAGAEGGPRVHAEVPGNRAARVAQRVGDPDAAFARAAHVFRERLTIERSCGSPLETRGVVADWDARTGMLKEWI